MLKFDFVWDDNIPKGSAEDVTSGTCNAFVNNKKIWNSTHNLWIDFLEHLTLSWNSLFTGTKVKETASEIDKLEFELNHDLSKGIKGKMMPSIYIYRHGNDFEIMVGEEKFKTSFADTGRNLTAIGDRIALRLRNCRDLRAKTALENWTKKKVYRYG